MPHSLFSLNFDVLQNILQLISPHDAAQLALVSKAAYALAFPHFVSDITLGGVFYKPSSSAVSQLKTFCNFVLAPAPCWHGAPTARLDALRSLEVRRDAVRVRNGSSRVVDTSAVSLLATVLTRAPNLQKVTLWGSDALYTAYPSLGFSSSASVQHLSLGGDIAPLSELAQTFPHLHTLEFVPGGGSCVPDWAFDAPAVEDVEALRPWRKTLQHVDAGFPIVALAACPVRCVDLRNPIVPDDESLLLGNTFLSGTRPVVLSALLGTGFRPEQVEALLRREAAPRMRFLELLADRCESLKEGFDWTMNVARGLAQIAPHLPLLGISLSATPAAVSAFSLKQQAGLDVPADVPTPVDVAVVARTVAESVPTLEFVAVDLTAVKSATGAERAWFAVREDARALGARRVVRMGEKEGHATVARMRAFDRYD